MTRIDEDEDTRLLLVKTRTPETDSYASISDPQQHRRTRSSDTPVTPGKISRSLPYNTIQEVAAAAGGDGAGGGGNTKATTTHNDPSLRDFLQKTHLRGSTRMLHSAYLQSTPTSRPNTDGLHHRKVSSSSTPGGSKIALPFLDEHDAEYTNFPPLPCLGSDNAKRTFNVDAEDDSFYSLRASFRRQSFAQSVRAVVQHVNKGFVQDARSLAEGTIPQSVVLSFAIGILCGVACYLYYSVLYFLLGFIWKTVPETYVEPYWDEVYYWLYTPLVSFSFATLVGLSVVFLGEPGDLPFTIHCIHTTAYIPMDHVKPMFFASLFSILAGGSLGPEAPLVAMCGALGGFVSRNVFQQTNVHVIRKHTLMGMAGALSAFFGCPLGGSLFALEVNSRFGIEYFEHLVEAIFAGEITLVVFRGLSGLPIAPIWDLTIENNGKHMIETAPRMVVIGGLIGILGAGAAYAFATFHWAQMALFDNLGLLEDNSKAVYRATLGCVVIVGVGVLMPYTMFWGEEEFQVIASMSPAKDLPFVWPPQGLVGFELDSPLKAFLVGCGKMVTISYTVTAGFRGGYIFPLFATGASFGRVLYYFFPCLSLPVAILSFSAGMNVAITRTALATTIILCFLGGELFAMPAILAASLCSLFATAYVPFIKTQITRSDLDHSTFHQKKIVTKIPHQEMD